jgi:hypothetical protein
VNDKHLCVARVVPLSGSSRWPSRLALMMNSETERLQRCGPGFAWGVTIRRPITSLIGIKCP